MFRWSALLSVLVPAGVATAAAQSGETGGFIVRLGSDTVAVERFTRGTDRLEGVCVVRTPHTAARRYSVALAPDGAARRLEMWTAAPPESTTLEFAGEHAGVIPYVSNCWGFLELAARRLKAAADDSLTQPALTPGPRPAPRTITLARAAADSATIEVIAGLPYRVALDRVGRIRGAAWPGEWSVTRVASLDIDRLAADFEQRPLGPLSPADSVRASLGDATLAIKYGRPSKRGRTIFGGVVPWNQVWRTGANEATLFITSADLEIGGATVPAGSYTLWTLPGPTAWKLIVNKNTGQWGTDYEPRHDLARFDLRVERLTSPVEQFTITIEPRGAGGELRLEWEITRASIEVRPKPPVGQ